MAEKNTIKIDVPKDALSTTQPNEFVPENKKTREWYGQMCRYYCRYYNPQKYNFDVDGNVNTNSGTAYQNWSMRISDDMVNNFAYLWGEQPNINYRYLEQDSTGRTFGNPWIKGRNAGKIIDFAHGDLLGSLQNITFDAISLSKDVIAKKNDLFDKINLAYELKDALAPIQKMGVKFQPYSKDFDMQEDIEEEKENYKDDLEDVAIEITEDIYTRENLKFKYANTYLDSLCGLAAIYNYVVNGKLKKKQIECFNVIWDNRRNDQFGEGMKFWGFIEYRTPAQWVEACPELADIPDAVNQLRSLGNNAVENVTEFTTWYNQGWDNGMKWFDNVNGTWMVAGVTMFFIAPRDLKFIRSTKDGKRLYEKGSDGDLFFKDDIGNLVSYKGKTYIKKQEGDQSIKENEKYQYETGDFLTNAVHKVTMIGNKWTTNFGYEKNILRNYYNKGEPIPNMSFFIPGMKFGQPRPIMGIVKKNQDEIDRLGKRLRDLEARDYGKIPVINAAMAGETGKDAIAFADDLKNNGILVARTSSEFLQLTRDMKMVEVIDLSASANILQYLELKREEERQMEEFVGLSKTALGQQKQYVSGQVQSQSANYGSNIMRNVVDGFFEFMRRDLQISMNIQKMLDASGKNKDSGLVIGTKGVRLVKAMKGRQFEDLLLYIRIQDSISENDRQLLLSWGQMWASDSSKSGIGADDLLMLISEKSISQMIRKLKLSIKRNKMNAQQQQAYQNQIEMMQQQQALTAQGKMSAEQLAASYRQKLDEILLKGSLDIKKEEVKSGLELAYNRDDKIIDATIARISEGEQAATTTPQEVATE